jgi:putative transposase
VKPSGHASSFLDRPGANFIGRTGCQWRYLPERYGSWTAVWAQWRRWRANGVWAAAMARLAAIVRVLHDREPIPSMVMVDAQTVKCGRYGPTFHEAGGRGGRTIGTKRTLLVEILGLPLAARADSARPHDVVAARELLRDRLAPISRASARSSATGPTAVSRRSPSASTSRSTSRRRHRGRVASSRSDRSTGSSTRSPELGRWRRLSRCYEGTEASARAWLEVASVGYLAWRAAA